MRSLRVRLALACALASAIVSVTGRARTLEDYRYFRALTIDLVGRTPTPDELATFERDDFDVNAWIDRHLEGPAYAERLRRVYMDLLRLDVGPTFQFVPPSVVLRRQEIVGPDGRREYVYFRQGQRRARAETDGEFCLTLSETGLRFPRNAPAVGTPTPVAAEVLERYTTRVRPWWLYRDDRSANPVDRFGPAWTTSVPGFVPAPGLLTEPDGSPTIAVRVCREEALASAMGTVFASGRTAPPRPRPPSSAPPGASSSPAPMDTVFPGRTTPLPIDTPFARQHHGEPIACNSGSAFQNSADCGCGIGLENCMPGDGSNFEPHAFVFPSHAPLGLDDPFDQLPQPASSWERLWWSQEAVHVFDRVFAEDRDLRELLTGRGSVINGPLAQFYRSIAPATCCGPGLQFGYTSPEPLFDPRHIPDTLAPQDVTTWLPIDDRGPHAAGLLTMPVFLTKYGSRRARAHVLYNAFLCRDFVAETVELVPSSEPDLTVRPGCSTCHATLEPLSAYFARVTESDWTWLPPAQFPVDAATCARADARRIPGFCRNYYDPAFTDAHRALLRGAYASTTHADAGPQGLAQAIVNDERFAPCVASNIASAFLGRPLGSDDDALRRRLAEALVSSGYRPRAMVRALLQSAEYRRANNLDSPTWRRAGGS